MNGIYQIQSGFPHSVKSNDVSGSRSSTFPRPNVIGDVHAPDADPNRIFNRFAFAQQPAGTFGNAGRNILRGAGLNNLDLSFFKNTYVTEKVNLQFARSSSNFLNDTQFGPYPGVIFNLLPTALFGAYQIAQQETRVLQVALKVIF